MIRIEPDKIVETIKSTSDFVKLVSEISKKFIKNGFDRNEIPLFRGHDNKSYELIPSIGRNRVSKFQITIFNEERNLIDTCKYKMPDVFRNELSPIELLALLQHHGIPTRLLDVTESALVALYFACCKEPTKDGEVFVFRCNEKNTTNYPLIEALADSYRFANDTYCDIELFYQRVYDQPYFLEQRRTIDALREMTPKELDQNFQVSSFEDYIIKLCEEPLFVFAPIRSFRQQIQRGRYILFPNAIRDLEDEGVTGKRYFTSKIDPLSKNHKCVAGELVVPSSAKEQILRELRLFGISEDYLFCDNVDIVCSNIKKSFQDKIDG